MRLARVSRASRPFAKVDRAAYMRFHRSLQPASKRAARGDKCPNNVRDAIAKDPMKHAYYLQLWHASEQSWGQVVAYERKYSMQATGTKVVEEWLTMGQLQDIYKDKKVVQAVRARVHMHPRTQRVCSRHGTYAGAALMLNATCNLGRVTYDAMPLRRERVLNTRVLSRRSSAARATRRRGRTQRYPAAKRRRSFSA